MNANRSHWPEYLIEALALGTFMLVACAAGALLGHPASPVHRALGDGVAQRLVMGLCMGLTAIAIVYSPWGRRSGAHLNPALTLTFLRLGKVARRDALAYVAAQFAGGVLGMLLARLSGMSMNPARSFGSALVAGDWTALWVYFTAPPLGMLLAAQLYLARRGAGAVACPKMAHATPCLFCEHAGTIAASEHLQPATKGALASTNPRGRPWRTTPTSTSSSSAAAPAAAPSPTASRPPASAS